VRSKATGERKREAAGPATAPPPVAGGSSETLAASGISTVSGITASTKLLELAHGLYGLSIGEIKGDRRELAGLMTPATHITSFPGEGLVGIEVFAASAGPAGWLGPGGGTVGIKIPSDRGHVLITTYRLADQEAVPLEIQIVRIDRSVQKMPAAASGREISPGEQRTARAAEEPAQDVKMEIVLHVERMGDCRFAGGEWIGSRDQGRRIEAFSIRPLDKLATTDIEYKAYGPGGRETPWVTAATLCGTRGQGIPLTGFAVRLGSQPSERFDVVYEGAFMESGVVGPRRNGEPCVPSRTDDRLEAVKIRVIERVRAPAGSDWRVPGAQS
jgi:hypothetical protein